MTQSFIKKKKEAKKEKKNKIEKDTKEDDIT